MPDSQLHDSVLEEIIYLIIHTPNALKIELQEFYLGNENRFISETADYFNKTRDGQSLSIFKKFYDGLLSFGDQIIWMYRPELNRYCKKQLFNHLKVVESCVEKREILDFILYVAQISSREGSPYAFSYSKGLYDIVRSVDEHRYEELKQFGTGQIERHLTYYEDENVSFQANDFFGEFNIKILKDNAFAYLKALQMINELLLLRFPTNIGINVVGVNLIELEGENLPKCMENGFFTSAVRYDVTYPEIVKYCQLVFKTRGNYNRFLKTESEIVPLGSFAVAALLYKDLKFTDIATKYIDYVDQEYTYIHRCIFDILFKYHGVNEKTVELFFHIYHSYDPNQIPSSDVFLKYFDSVEKIKLLSPYKIKFQKQEWQMVVFMVALLGGFGTWESALDGYIFQGEMQQAFLDVYHKDDD